MDIRWCQNKIIFQVFFFPLQQYDNPTDLKFSRNQKRLWLGFCWKQVIHLYFYMSVGLNDYLFYICLSNWPGFITSKLFYIHFLWLRESYFLSNVKANHPTQRGIVAGGKFKLLNNMCYEKVVSFIHLLDYFDENTKFVLFYSQVEVYI